MLAAFLSAAVVEAAAGVDAEVAAGRAPVQLTGPEENSLAFTLVPGAALRLRSQSDTLALTYTPRIFYRVPNALQIDRPLLLHQIALDHTATLSRRMAWTSVAALSIGELDYTASNLVFDPGTSAVRTSVTEIIRADGQTGFRFDVTRRLRWTLDFSAEYTTPLGEQQELTDETAPDLGDIQFGAVPESAQASLQSGISYATSRSDRIGVNGEVTYQWFPDTGRFLLLSPSLSWESQLSRRTNIGLSGGVAYVIALETLPGIDSGNSFGGTGSFEYDSVVYRARSAVVTLGFNASLDWFFDPVAGTSQPRAGVDGSANIEIGRDWQITPNASFYTLLRDSDTGVSPDTPDVVVVDATTLRAELPFSYRLSDFAYLSFGGRGSLRGRSLTQDNFRLDERVEIWAFVGLTLRFATGRDMGQWLAL